MFFKFSLKIFFFCVKHLNTSSLKLLNKTIQWLECNWLIVLFPINYKNHTVLLKWKLFFLQTWNVFAFFSDYIPLLSDSRTFIFFYLNKFNSFLFTFGELEFFIFLLRSENWKFIFVDLLNLSILKHTNPCIDKQNDRDL